MNELIEFLLARTAEDEAVAREARLEEYLTTRDSSGLLVGMRDGYTHVVATSGRVLAECESKRLLIQQAESLVGYVDATREDSVHTYERTLTRLLAPLALPYADRPDYRQEWRPSAHHPSEES